MRRRAVRGVTRGQGPADRRELRGARGPARPAPSLGAALVVALCAGGAAGGEGDSASASRAVELDKLLELPDSLQYEVERRGGRTRSEWELHFQEARDAIEQARADLERAQQELEGLASETSQWQLAPPGAGAANPDAPLSYRLRQDIRRYKAELERSEQRLRDLEIEANLAGVPEAWRGREDRQEEAREEESRVGERRQP